MSATAVRHARAKRSDGRETLLATLVVLGGVLVIVGAVLWQVIVWGLVATMYATGAILFLAFWIAVYAVKACIFLLALPLMLLFRL